MQKRVLIYSLFILAAAGAVFLCWPRAAQISDIEQLGEKLFHDARLSEPEGVSCASCHESGRAFQGDNGSGRAGVAQGSRPGHFTVRNTPSLMYTAYTPPFSFVEEKNEKGEVEHVPTGGQFLDGRAADLSAQVEGPLLHPDEMNNASKAAVVEKVKNGPYAGLARKAFGDDVFHDPDTAFVRLATALAAFESTPAFARFSSKFDDVLRGNARLSEAEARGFALFKDPQKGNCIACHVGKDESKEPSDWLFTDFTYDAIGAPRNAAIPANADAAHYDLGLCRQPGIEKIAPKGFDVESLCGAFKVPTLRNIAVTSPYMHNGVFKDLRDVVKFYAARDTSPELWYSKNPDGSVKKFDDLPAQYHNNVNTSEAPYDRKPGEKPRLTDDEIDDLVAFLKTLTDKRL